MRFSKFASATRQRNILMCYLLIHTGCVAITIKMMFSLLYTFRLHFYLINIHIFDYPEYLPRSRRVRIIEVWLYQQLMFWSSAKSLSAKLKRDQTGCYQTVFSSSPNNTGLAINYTRKFFPHLICLILGIDSESADVIRCLVSSYCRALDCLGRSRFQATDWT